MLLRHDDRKCVGHYIDGHRQGPDDFAVRFDPRLVSRISFDMPASDQSRFGNLRLSSHASAKRGQIRKVARLRRKNVDLEPWFFKLRSRSYHHASAVTFAVADQRKGAFITMAVYFDPERFAAPLKEMLYARHPKCEIA